MVPGLPMTRALWKFIQQDMATKHFMQDIQDDIHCMWACTIVLEKCYVHVSYSPNDQNDLILPLLQVPLVCYGSCHKYLSNKPLLADCTPHSAFYRIE